MDFPISVPSIGLVDGKFADEDPLGGTPGSLIPAVWGNSVTLEMLNVIEAAGLTPDEENSAQLLQAIKSILASATPGASETVLGLVKLATQVQADAGANDTAALTAKKLAVAIRSQSLAAFTTAGTATALTLTPTPAVAGYVTNQRFNVKFSVTGGVNPTLNVSGQGAKSLKQYTSSGAKVAATFAADQISDVVYDGVDFMVLDPLPAVLSGDPWEFQPIGVPIPLFTHMAGVTTPPTNKAYRYISLTAADAYNTGVLTGEVVSFPAPLIVATAVINLAGSPLNGQTVYLINTERRVLRAGQSGVIENDQFQGHRMSALSSNFINGGSLNTAPGSSYAGGVNTNATTGNPVSDGANGAPRVGDETRSKAIGVTYFMRIK